MGTILYLTDADFNNPNLPVVTPFAIDDIIRPGLTGAWRPANSLQSTRDLSGNGVSLAQVGIPAFGGQGVTCSNAGATTHGLVTGLHETKNITTICTFRLLQNEGGTWGNDNESFGALTSSTYSVDGNTSSRGVGHGGGSTTTNPKEISLLGMMSFYKTDTQTYTYSSVRKTVATGTTSDLSTIPQSAVPWVFSAIAIDGDGNKAEWHVPTIGYKWTGVYASTVYDLGRRLLADSVTGVPNTIPIGIPQPNYTWAGSYGRCIVAELLVYDRPMSEQEIMAQYNLSKNWMLINRGIVI